MIRSLIKVHGGKSYLAKRIVSMFPSHRLYVEPYCGGLSVLLAKPRSPVEVAGDLNAALVHFWTTVRDRPAELADRVRSVPYLRESFEQAYEALEAVDPIDRAVAFLIRNRMSRGGLGKHFAWSERLRGGQPGDLNAWESIQRLLPAISARLQGVELYCGDALDLIERYDGESTLTYCDPPYPHSTRTVAACYTHEMSDADHERLLVAVKRAQGMVVLSGYRSAIYDAALEGWERHEFHMANHSGQTRRKNRRVEVVWLNPACDRFELRG